MALIDALDQLDKQLRVRRVSLSATTCEPENEEEWNIFFQAWESTLGDAWVTSSQLVDRLHHSLPKSVCYSFPSVRLGKVLAKRSDIHKRRDRNKIYLWRIQHMEVSQ
jgi:hypothetical protein